MKLQVALDMMNVEHALRVANQVREHVEILEIGTPLIKFAGVSIVHQLREQFPEKEILVDLKTMDAGEYEVTPFLEAGSDLVTVLSVADDDTIRGVIRATQKHHGYTVVDLINTPNLQQRAEEVAELGADYIAVHSGIDQQARGGSPIEGLRALRDSLQSKTVVAGGIKLESIDYVAALRPGIIVVGGAITSAKEPGKMARAIKERIVRQAIPV